MEGGDGDEEEAEEEGEGDGGDAGAGVDHAVVGGLEEVGEALTLPVQHPKLILHLWEGNTIWMKANQVFFRSILPLIRRVCRRGNAISLFTAGNLLKKAKQNVHLLEAARSRFPIHGGGDLFQIVMSSLEM